MTTKRLDGRVATGLITQDTEGIADSNLPIAFKVGEVANALGFGGTTKKDDNDFISFVSSTEPDEGVRRLNENAPERGPELVPILLAIFGIRGLLPEVLEEVYKPLWK